MAATADRTAQRALVERFARERPGAVLWDASGATLLDVFSGKALPVDLSHVASVEERIDATTRRPYLAVLRDDGVEIALTEAGIAFAPVTVATGPLEGLPAAVCFRDLAVAQAQLEHFLVGHAGEPPDRGHVALFLLCLAIVDGARAAGFEVSREERHLERMLGDLEARRRG